MPSLHGYTDGEDTKVSLPRKEYDELVDDQKFLRALEAAGVDSWEGYEEAQNMMEE